MKQSNFKIDADVIGLDLGQARTGVARANPIARIAEPLTDIEMKNADLIGSVSEEIAKHSACCIVVGLPRGLEGQNTAQTDWAASIIDTLKKKLSIPVFFIDEAATTKQAEEIIRKGQTIDGVAAGVILESFLEEVRMGRVDNVSI